ncbi:PKD domain-containing protein [Fluviicola sp.]|jgi:PKD repeat protein|uniref:PKD domain-containing protein n=1 Tax=Fluviicola sp. TaxID=1917219 RepID=UPI00282F246A|nr:PKD domain-containing protein [Fluviicola sp.]MDR0801520.1 PKD domain-containing protein [Fluviicola sp.]
MKRILLGLSLLISTSYVNSQTQIGNSDFELWETSTQETNEPINWNAFMTADGSAASLGKGKNLDRSTIVRPGSTGTYSARIWTRNVIFAKANGNMTLGRVHMGSTSASNIENYNYSDTPNADFSEAFTDTPDSIVVWVRYTLGGSTQENARVSVVIHKDISFRDAKDFNPTYNNVDKVIAQAQTSAISPNGGAWQRLSIPFVYTGQPTSETAYILATFTSCKTPSGGNVNDELLVDDIELIYVPKASFTASVSSVCAGSSLNFTNTSTNYPTSYSWNFGDGTANSTQENPSHTFATAGTYNVTLTVTNQWGSTTSTTTAITVNALPNASLSYTQSAYCPADANPAPAVTNAGTFTSTTGLSINATTGQIDLSASTPGTYTVTNTYTGICVNTGTTTITINPPANSTFSYPSNTICSTDDNQTPTIADAGTFSSTPAGLVFVSTTTGEIDVAGSAEGTYTITYTASGSSICPTSPSASNSNITITSNPDASFTYSAEAYCSDATNPAPIFGTGANGGAFSASPSGLSINSNSGIIDLSASTPGTYIVTNNIAAAGSCPEAFETFTVEVKALPNVTLGTFTDVCVYNNSFTLTGGAPTGGIYSGTGINAGSFDPTDAGLGTKTITYSYTDTNGCSNTATNTILVDECLGLENNTLSAVSVYPNPTDGKLIISNVAQETSFKVISTSGQVVLAGIISNTANTIDLSAVENGVYMLQLTQEQAIQTIRIVKK